MWNNGHVTSTSLVVQGHALAGRDNSMRVSIEEDPALGVHTYIWVTNVPKWWEGVQGRKCLGKKSVLKTIALAIKWDKLVTEKPGKSKQPVVINWWRPSWVLEAKVEIQCHRKVAQE